MTRPPIPFIRGTTECELVSKFYADVEIVRVEAVSAPKLRAKLPTRINLWVDSGTDAFHEGQPTNEKVGNFLSPFNPQGKMARKSFHSKPERPVVSEYVDSVLSTCAKSQPSWISVPQLPMVGDGSRNKINRFLAEETALWKTRHGFSGRIILPVVLTHQRQVNHKTERNKKIELVASCYERSDADGVWVVESSLSDQTGSPTYQRTRFPALLKFHEELNDRLHEPRTLSIAGPYWGLNLVLWAKGLATHAAIGVGSGYQYHVPGYIKEGKSRIAIPPLRRQALWSSELQEWLRKAIKASPPSEPGTLELKDLEKRFARFRTKSVAKAQLAEFYADWIALIRSKRPASLGFYEDLSAAYVFGKALPELPRSEAPGRPAERIAEQLMLIAL